MSHRETTSQNSNGEAARPGRIQKIRDGLGQRAAARAAHEADTLRAANRERFEAALAVAEGPNKTALELIKTAAARQTDMAYDPFSSGTWRGEDGSHYYQWSTELSDGTYPGRSPRTVQVAGDFPELSITYPQTSGSGHHIPVRGLTVVVEAPIDPFGVIGPASSSVSVNRMTNSADKEPRTSRPIPTGAVRVDLAPDGQVAEVGVERQHSPGYGYHPDGTERGADPHIVEFLQGVQQVVEQPNPPQQ